MHGNFYVWEDSDISFADILFYSLYFTQRVGYVNLTRLFPPVWRHARLKSAQRPFWVSHLNAGKLCELFLDQRNTLSILSPDFEAPLTNGALPTAAF